MEIYNIASISNEKIKNLKKLGLKKTRDESSQFLVENLLIIHDAIKSGFKPIALFVTQEIIDKNNSKLKYIINNMDEVFVINEKINKFFSSLATPSGICAVYKKQEKDVLVEAHSDASLDKIIVYLNGVSDPGNLGTIIRTTLAFGIENIVLDALCADVYNPKTINAARDAIFKVNIAHDVDLFVFNQIKEKMKIYATNIERGISIKDVIKEEQVFCIVLGNEANGVSEPILRQSDSFVKINMSNKIESLNVAISAGIILNEIWQHFDL